MHQLLLNPFTKVKKVFMFNPPDFGSYIDLKKRLIQRMKAAKVDDQIFEAVQKLFENTLNSEKIVLSRPERERLLRQIVKSVLTDMLTKLDGDK
jgi:hypothetical protein